MTGLPATASARMAGWLAAVGSAGGLRADGGQGGDGGGVGWQLAQQIPWQVWLVAVGVLLVLALIVVLWARHVWRRSRRRGVLAPERVEGGLLALQAYGLPAGPARDAAVLRRRLSSDVNSTRMAVAAAAAAAPVGELAAVVDRLAAAAGTVDGQLAALAYESDPGRRAAGLGATRPAAEQILGAAARIRTALVSTRAALDEPALAAVSRDVDEELTGLAAYTQAYRELGGGQV